MFAVKGRESPVPDSGSRTGWTRGQRRAVGGGPARQPCSRAPTRAAGALPPGKVPGPLPRPGDPRTPGAIQGVARVGGAQPHTPGGSNFDIKNRKHRESSLGSLRRVKGRRGQGGGWGADR